MSRLWKVYLRGFYAAIADIAPKSPILDPVEVLGKQFEPSTIETEPTIVTLTIAALAIALSKSELAELDAMTALVGFAVGNLGKTVGGGQCADLPAEGLTTVGAKPFGSWQDFPSEGDYVWGKRSATLTPESNQSDLKPGEVLQFRDVKIVTRSGNAKFTFRAEHHTAIVEGFDPQTRVAKILEQNSQGRTYVTRGSIDLKGLQSGTIWVYRPEPRAASGR